MKFIISVLLVAVLSAFASAASQVNLPTYTRLSNNEVVDIQQDLKARGGCNANVCFALDGSASIPPAEFLAQKNFVLDMEAILNPGREVELAAVQYGARNSPISRLTTDGTRFNLAVDAARQLNSERTVIRAGIVWCFNQLKRRRGEALKIVLLGDGEATTIGNPVPIAKRFRRIRGEICAVGVGFNNTQSLLNIVGGDPSKVLTVDDFFELSDIIENLVEQVCDVNL